MSKSKKDEVALELFDLELKRRDNVFKDQLSINKIKELAAIIRMCLDSGKDDRYIQKLTGLSKSQIEIVKTHPSYYNSIHSIEDDAAITRTLLRAAKVEVTEALIDEAKQGNCKAIGIYFDKVDKTDDASNSLQNVYRDLMRQLGILNPVEQANLKIQEAKEQSIEVDATVIGESDSEDPFEDETPDEYRLRILKGLMKK